MPHPKNYDTLARNESNFIALFIMGGELRIFTRCKLYNSGIRPCASWKPRLSPTNAMTFGEEFGNEIALDEAILITGWYVSRLERSHCHVTRSNG